MYIFDSLITSVLFIFAIVVGVNAAMGDDPLRTTLERGVGVAIMAFGYGFLDGHGALLGLACGALPIFGLVAHLLSRFPIFYRVFGANSLD